METNKTEEKIKKLDSETKEINRIDSEIKESKKEMSNFNNKLGDDIKSFYTEKLGISKFIMEHDLKNIDVILDILKITTSLSISLFIASLTTPYFNEKIDIIISLNFILIILLVIFIKKRKDILSNGKIDLLETIEALYDITENTLLSELDNRITPKHKNIQKKINKIKSQK